MFVATIGALGVYAQAVERPRLLTPAELSAAQAHLLTELIPNFASDLKPDPKQAFRLFGRGTAKLDIVPVRFSSKNEAAGNTSTRCGVFVVQAGSTTFVPTVGYDWMETEFCGGLDAVGFLPAKAGGFARVLLLYSSGSAHESGKEPVVLDYSAKLLTYKGNETLSETLQNSAGPATIADMKKHIAEEDAKGR